VNESKSASVLAATGAASVGAARSTGSATMAASVSATLLRPRLGSATSRDEGIATRSRTVTSASREANERMRAGISAT
jgi:hypothetical protein